MDFFGMLGFWQESHWFYTSIFKKLHTIYQHHNSSCCFYGEFHLVLLSATTWRSNLWVIRKIWLSEYLQFDNHFFSNHKSESLIPWHTFMLYIFLKSAILKNCKILFPRKCFVFAKYIANIIFRSCTGLIFII